MCCGQLAAQEALPDECAADAEQAPASYGRLVLIIDDLGHSLTMGKAALSLPGKLNFAVIPYTPHGRRIAASAHRQGKEVMLHAPMSTIGQDPLGPGGLSPELSRKEFRNTLADALDQYPEVVGINNHMGSDLTQRRTQMAWVMQELRWRDLYFVDSRTSHNSVAANVASEFSVPHLTRHVFLDHEPTTENIHARFQEALARVKRRGYGVAIGHPYPQTLRYLERALPQLEEQGVRLAYVSEMLGRTGPRYAHNNLPALAMSDEMPCDDEERVADVLEGPSISAPEET
ncbi:MAG: divergent polysaccharide deacetylase family protein [Halioglobus sp.]|nr:divergent polysaccharide deacetylase family protein [Halioglobus sp.]